MKKKLLSHFECKMAILQLKTFFFNFQKTVKRRKNGLNSTFTIYSRHQKIFQMRKTTKNRSLKMISLFKKRKFSSPNKEAISSAGKNILLSKCFV